MEGLNRTKRILATLELFEWVGLFASGAAIWVFFHYASALDMLVGEPGYHWQVVGIIGSIYAHFVPWALGVGTVLLVLLGRSKRLGRAAMLRKWWFGARVFLAYCVLLIVFRVVNFYVPVIHPGLDDPVIQHIDRTVFFGKLVSEWLEPISTHWLTHIMTAAYVSWFWLLFATIVLLLVKDPRAVSEYVLASMLTFYVGYIGYLLVPVIGPGYTVHYSVMLGDIAPTFTTQTLLISRDCFPSLHTALSAIMLIYVRRWQPKWQSLYWVLAPTIILATLYLRFHYGLDDIVGLVLALIMATVAPILRRAWNRAILPKSGIHSGIPSYWFQETKQAELVGETGSRGEL